VTRSGFVALAGRPNVGKSTLLNGLVGDKVAIVSPRPQTTRRAIRGVATGDDWQLVMVDLPGVQRPRDPLTERMQRRMEHELRESDAALFVLNGDQGVGPGDRFIAEAIKRVEVPAVTVLNKIDLLNRSRTMQALEAVAELGVPGEIYPVSAKTGTGVQEVLAALIGMLPDGPLLYPSDEKTDLPLQVRVAEVIREKILHRTHDELPHSVEVQVEEMKQEDDLITIRAYAWAETESQKAILIGAGGRMVKEVGSAARKDLEGMLGKRIYLDLGIRVRRGWRSDESLLDRLGIE
jgi:GTP-binding protein Era